MKPFLPCALKPDHIVGFHVWRNPLKNREPKSLRITFTKLRVPAMARGSVVQPSPEDISFSVGRPHVAFAIAGIEDVVDTPPGVSRKPLPVQRQSPLTVLSRTGFVG